MFLYPVKCQIFSGSNQLSYSQFNHLCPIIVITPVHVCTLPSVHARTHTHTNTLKIIFYVQKLCCSQLVFTTCNILSSLLWKMYSHSRGLNTLPESLGEMLSNTTNLSLQHGSLICLTVEQVGVILLTFHFMLFNFMKFRSCCYCQAFSR